jgi:hypothetical protein
VGEVLIVVVGYAFGPAIIAKWMAGLPGSGVNALALSLTAIVYVPVVAATHAWPRAWPSTSVLVSVAMLGIVCSALAFMIMTALVAEIGPVRTTTVTYVNPAVALVAGAVVLGEPVTAWSVGGFALILAGCALVTFRRPPLPARPAALPARPAARSRGANHDISGTSESPGGSHALVNRRARTGRACHTPKARRSARTSQTPPRPRWG